MRAFDSPPNRQGSQARTRSQRTDRLFDSPPNRQGSQAMTARRDVRIRFDSPPNRQGSQALVKITGVPVGFDSPPNRQGSQAVHPLNHGRCRFDSPPNRQGSQAEGSQAFDSKEKTSFFTLKKSFFLSRFRGQRRIFFQSQPRNIDGGIVIAVMLGCAIRTCPHLFSAQRAVNMTTVMTAL